MDIFKFAIGPEAHVEAKFEGANAVLTASYKGEDGVEIGLTVKAAPKRAFETLKEMIPGKLDDMAIDALVAYLGLD